MRGPGAIFLKPDTSLGEGITQASSALAKALGQREAKKTEQNTYSALQEALNTNDFTNLLGRNDLNNEIIAKNLPQYMKLATERNILNKVGFGKETQENALPAYNQISQNPVENLSEEELVQLQGVPNSTIKGIAQAELKRRSLDIRREESDRRKFESERDFESKQSLPYLQELDKERDEIETKRMALSLMEDAIREGNTGFFSPDNFANFLGRFGEGLRTAKGVQLINAQKEFLLGNISRAGSRPNQWIEQQILSMLTNPGRSKEANLAVVESLKAQLDLKQAKQLIADELVEKYRNEKGYVPGNIAAEVGKKLRLEADKINDRLSYKLRDIYEKEQGDLSKLVTKTVSQGTPLTVNMANQLVKSTNGDKEKALRLATKLGYRIPTKEEIEGYSS